MATRTSSPPGSAPAGSQAFLFSAYTDSTRDENARPAGAARQAAHPLHAHVLPKSLTPGTVAFVGRAGGLDMHGDFVTRAWQADPLKQALSMIPGYAPVHGKKSA